MEQGFIKEEGFTLIDTLVALYLAGIVIAGLILVLWLGNNVFNSQVNCLDLQYSCRRAREKIMDEFCRSTSFTIKPDKYSAPGVAVEPGQPGACLHLVVGTEEVDYYAGNGQLYRDSNLASPQPVAGNINSAVFCNPVPGLLEVNITAAAGDSTATVQTTCTSRMD